jgi:bla regulator protein BlaR1
MSQRSAFKTTLFLIAGCTAASAQPPAVPEWQTAAGGKMAFEVASIKPSNPGKFTPPAFPLDSGDAYASVNGRFSADFPLGVYISFAYKLSMTAGQMQAMIEHLPKWVASDRFSIQAKAEGNPTKDQMRLMMQSLLADRFQLAVHFETHDAPIFVLTLAKPGKLGPKLRPHADGPPCDTPDPKVFPDRCYVYAMTMFPGKMPMTGSRNTTMDLLASGLSNLGRLGRPVIDQTGLTGRFDFTLEWMGERIGPAPLEASAPTDLQGPTFLEALREQLGLKLESSKGPVQILVVDHVERPSEN